MNIKRRTDEEDLTYYLLKFNFEIIYFSGKNNIETEVDTSSRNLVFKSYENNESSLKVLHFVKLADIRNDE